jgi:UDP-N-acetylmuramate: L-alanyl-gamma-D-glutamyl-meso-diaminopimelate ligase
MIPEPPLMEKIPENERFSSRRLVNDLRERNLEAFYFENTSSLLEGILNMVKRGDVLLIMSNGGFDNIHQRLLEKL